MTSPPHSYYSVGVKIPNYVSTEWSSLALASTFAVTYTIVLTAAMTIATKVNPRIAIPELSKVVWFTLCMYFLPYFAIYAIPRTNICPDSSIHLVLEDYYALKFASLPCSQHLLASTPCLICAISLRTRL